MPLPFTSPLFFTRPHTTFGVNFDTENSEFCDSDGGNVSVIVVGGAAESLYTTKNEVYNIRLLF